FFFFFSSRRRHTRFSRDWSSDVCSSDLETLPEAPFYYNHEAKAGERAAITFALSWLPDGGTPIQESYVNLIPTAQGGTHVNGLCTGILEALREFCDIHNLLSRNVKFTAEDVWVAVNSILSLKLSDPQFSGQTKERPSSREPAGAVQTLAKDSFSLSLNQPAD